ncbi:MAG TPA: YkvA family protein [Frankiaceae bacterium]|nr:YkvA family protein [Frankiaceae bacterium]
MSKASAGDQPDLSMLTAQLQDAGREALRFVPDAMAMLRGVLIDPRVPQSVKVEAGAALAYLVSPVNRMTSWVPVVGKVDDVAVIAFALRRLLVGAGEPVLRDHWRGHPRGLEILLGLTTAFASPKGFLRRSAMVRAVLAALGEGGRKPGAGRVIDGEVLDRRERP